MDQPSLSLTEHINQAQRLCESWDDIDGEEDAGDEPEAVNEDGGDVLDEPHDPETDFTEGSEDEPAFSSTSREAEHGASRDAGPISTKIKRIASLRRNSPSRRGGLFHGLDPNHMPERYIMGVQGDCLSPEIKDGDRLEFSSTERPRIGDFVSIYRHSSYVRPGEWVVMVKRLVIDCSAAPEWGR